MMTLQAPPRERSFTNERVSEFEPYAVGLLVLHYVHPEAPEEIDIWIIAEAVGVGA